MPSDFDFARFHDYQVSRKISVIEPAESEDDLTVDYRFLRLSEIENSTIGCASKAMIANIEYLVACFGENGSYRPRKVFVDDEFGQVKR